MKYKRLKNTFLYATLKNSQFSDSKTYILSIFQMRSKKQYIKSEEEKITYATYNFMLYRKRWKISDASSDEKEK